MTQKTFNGLTAPNLADLDSNFTELYNNVSSLIANLDVHTATIVGNTTVTTTIPVPEASSNSGGGGGIVLIRGADGLSGAAESRLYLLACRVLAGATPDVASTLIASAGSTGASFTFGSTGSFVTITSSGTTMGSFTMLAIGM